MRVFKGWDWSSNGNFCRGGSRIILGWNVDAVDLNVVAMTDQVVHTFIRFKADKKELFCSFVYAHNKYTLRRPLWDNLGLHNQLVRNLPWCVLGDFNSALNLEDKVEGSSVIDIAMRDFKECVDANELVDINRSGLQFTWTQKLRGLDGTLWKIGRIMANLGFLDSFAGAHAIFQPYRVFDHSLAILHIPTMCKFKPRPFKFSNILVHNSKFKQQVQECRGTSVSGFHMFKVVSKLKALKKPFRSMLFREGNIHEKELYYSRTLSMFNRLYWCGKLSIMFYKIGIEQVWKFLLLLLVFLDFELLLSTNLFRLSKLMANGLCSGVVFPAVIYVPSVNQYHSQSDVRCNSAFTVTVSEAVCGGQSTYAYQQNDHELVANALSESSRCGSVIFLESNFFTLFTSKLASSVTHSFLLQDQEAGLSSNALAGLLQYIFMELELGGEWCRLLIIVQSIFRSRLNLTTPIR
ncbi:RNA-directed DNA polymerase, eukaryota, Reverse transcriptase zinc-binding domain protein [Artemisia annua]|uniref:RNA-directed DNA polymerase, eukaryota, Reverse transcriptase zinc-binding domain protein n=1 Tax=Artemisia annua TaxID=35608 RepID=A0A2U1NUC2_ARTAN|nr:RNA-directed DNA polymerase, eukaryota, Reverse transcriptase zinc-binding domain protein [Artemisia annua]